ncbi:hypothetical protein HAX54_050929, partial [Datura stramonium]|nr:hypothetical protein [Datura stramonium]
AVASLKVPGGCFNDPFHHSPKAETIQTWLLKRWQVKADLCVSLISHNTFSSFHPDKK